MLVCKVALGKVHEQSTVPSALEKFIFSEDSFYDKYGHSVKVSGGKVAGIHHNEWAVYKADQVFPAYLIEYTF